MPGSTFWIFVGVVVVTAIISDTVVKIIKASKSGSPKEMKDRIFELEEDLALMEQELEDSKRRLEVLEEIVTDEKQNLSRKIDDLASKG
ncbi:MAG: hypothetical protein ABGY96_15380 [bacterium]|nr:hypothetical protein [Gammaproteobacteria bacterium]HIL96858.1 hypothetical protein [Pseudomonadales bacterium]